MQMLNKDDVQHIANLARLGLTKEELKVYGDQLSAILGYVDQLQEVDTTSVETLTTENALVNVWREDEVKEWDRAEIDVALEQAGEIEDGQIKVKRILE